MGIPVCASTAIIHTSPLDPIVFIAHFHFVETEIEEFPRVDAVVKQRFRVDQAIREFEHFLASCVVHTLVLLFPGVFLALASASRLQL
jgi:hypothetical protein